jgi:hypothetical protein
MATMVQTVPATADEKRPTVVDTEKSGGVRSSDENFSDSDAKSEEFQDGVQRVRAVTAVWSKRSLWLMFAL